MRLNDREPRPLIRPEVGFTAEGPTELKFLTDTPTREGRLALPRLVFDAQWLLMLALSLWAVAVFRTLQWLIPTLLALPGFLLTLLPLFAVSIVALAGLAVLGCQRGRWLSLVLISVQDIPHFASQF